MNSDETTAEYREGQTARDWARIGIAEEQLEQGRPSVPWVDPRSGETILLTPGQYSAIISSQGGAYGDQDIRNWSDDELEAYSSDVDANLRKAPQVGDTGLEYTGYGAKERLRVDRERRRRESLRPPPVPRIDQPVPGAQGVRDAFEQPPAQRMVNPPPDTSAVRPIGPALVRPLPAPLDSSTAAPAPQSTREDSAAFNAFDRFYNEFNDRDPNDASALSSRDTVALGPAYPQDLPSAPRQAPGLTSPGYTMSGPSRSSGFRNLLQRDHNSLSPLDSLVRDTKVDSAMVYRINERRGIN